MSYFPDLTPYSYVDGLAGLNVGWLDGDHPFDAQPPSEAFIDGLWQFVKEPLVGFRGLYQCEICPRDADHDERLRALHARLKDPADPVRHVPMGKLPWPEDARTRSTLVRHRGDELRVGYAEIRVFGAADVVYAAPTLVFHYVVEHHYAPPSDFVHGVLFGPRPPSDEYRARLRPLGERLTAPR